MTTFLFEVASLKFYGQNSNVNGSRSRQIHVSNTKVAFSKKNSLESKLKLNSEVSQGKVVITLPIRTVSEANNFDHWTVKHKRHRIQKKTVAMVLNPVRSHVQFPCHIKLTRYAPRKLDKHDNLPISLKYVLDACCAIITGNFKAGRADDDERIVISYDQIVSSQYGVKVEFIFSSEKDNEGKYPSSM